ncbi:MAG: AAA family ATPase [Clostridia bacterium]|nr:AAA family ATPase [Clostridia bacterium]
MRIKRVEIASFGKFKNFSMDFESGFNIVFGKNEDGKSTIMAFILLMLYGNAGKSSQKDLTQNLRKKYLPWTGEKMAGDLEIEHKGRIYRIHKEFRSTSKTDLVTVTDIETGEKISLPPDTEVGKYFLGIDLSGFEKSIFSATSKSFAGEESGDISVRLSNLSQTGDESTSPKEAKERIESAMDDLVKKRAKGRLTLAQEASRTLAEEIEQAETREVRRNELKAEYKKIEEELGLLLEKAQKGRESLKNQEKRTRAKIYEALARLSDAVKIKGQELEILLKGDSVDAFLAQGEKLREDYDISLRKLKETDRGEEVKTVSEEDMKEYFILKEEIIQSEEKKGVWKAVLAGIFGILSIAAAVFGKGLLKALFIPALAVFVSSAIFFLIIFLKDKKVGQKKAKAEKDFEEFLKSKGCTEEAEFEKAYRKGIELSAKREIYDRAKKDFDEKEKSFILYIGKYESVSNAHEARTFLEKINEKNAEKIRLEKEAKTYGENYGVSEEDSGKLISLAEKLREEAPEETETIDAEAIEMAIREKNERLLEIKGQLGAEGANIETLKKELAQNLEKEKEMRAYYESLSLAAEVLAEAEDEMRRFFAPKLNERASEILSELTDGKYQKLSTDKEYEVEIKSEDTAGYRNWQYLSRGTMAQSYLALRIALCEMLSEEEQIPLLLDDVLNEYDEIREEKTMAFLDNYAKAGHQIILFGCRHIRGYEGKAKRLF